MNSPCVLIILTDYIKLTAKKEYGVYGIQFNLKTDALKIAL